MPAVAPAEARFGAIAMLCLTVMALLVAGVVYSASGFSTQVALFVALAAIGAWQTVHYWRH